MQRKGVLVINLGFTKELFDPSSCPSKEEKKDERTGKLMLQIALVKVIEDRSNLQGQFTDLSVSLVKRFEGGWIECHSTKP